MSASFPVPVAHASGEARATYLRRVLGYTFVGLCITAVSGVVGMAGLMAVPSLLGGFMPMILILGSFAITNYVAPRMVFGEAKWAGFLLGTIAQGLALSFILTVAVFQSYEQFGNPLALIGLAFGLTAASGVGMAAYSFTQRRDFSLIGAGLSALSIPMLVLMGVGFAFPAVLGGTFGLIVSVVFVFVSAAGLLYQLNKVIHEFTTDMPVEGAYTITIGVVVLFWNILSLLMRMRRN